MIGDQVLQKCHSTRLQHRLLREENHTRDVLLRIARAVKASDRQAQQIEDARKSESGGETSSAYAIHTGADTNRLRPPNASVSTTSTTEVQRVLLLL